MSFRRCRAVFRPRDWVLVGGALCPDKAHRRTCRGVHLRRDYGGQVPPLPQNPRDVAESVSFSSAVEPAKTSRFPLRIQFDRAATSWSRNNERDGDVASPGRSEQTCRGIKPLLQNPRNVAESVSFSSGAALKPAKTSRFPLRDGDVASP
jgi:hypothetical protein